MTEQTNALIHPNLHALIYGMSGSRKSTLAASFPKKMLVLAFDLWDNVKPYLRQGVEHYRADLYDGPDEARKKTAAYYQAIKVPCTDVRDEKGELLVRIEHYYNPNPKQYDAYMRFEARMAAFTQNPALLAPWRTVVLDSLTFLQSAVVGFERTIQNPGKNNRLNNFGEGRSHLEDTIFCRLGSLDSNVIIIGHEQVKEIKSKAGSLGALRGVASMGDLSTALPGGFGEVYHVTMEEDEEANLVSKVRTRPHLDEYGEKWFAKSQENVPDRCEPTYEALWQREAV